MYVHYMYNKDVNFTWDPKKARSNLQKHGVPFEEAVTVFYDPLAKVAHDPEHSNDEDRFILVGHSQKNRLLFVIHIYRESTNTIRIISARRATKREMRDFEELE
jgi:uncharacterized DUF497 family protein